jgi:colanic acid biosynthesis glycosyl transferase WcaI
MTRYRTELGIGDEPVVLYAGNVGFSQALDLLVEAARRLPGVTFLINGDGAARPELERAAGDAPNVRFAGYQPASRLAEVLATGDVHVVPLRAGLGDVSVPSKTYSSLAAGRPVVASIDLDSEIPRLLADSGAVLDEPARGAAMGAAGRAWAEREASPAAVGAAYDQLLRDVVAGRRRLMPRSPR